MKRLLLFFKLFRHDLIVILLAMRNSRTPKEIKALLIAAGLYLISPIDLIPDAIPFLGILDDAMIVPAAICGLTKLLPYDVRADAEAKADRISRYMPVIIILASILIISWVGLIVYGIYKLIF